MNPLSILLMLVAVAGSPARAAETRQPNILHIHADDHRADGLGALGTPLLKTPRLDEIVRRGTVFTHCYTQGSMIGAVCLPSRTMLLTGRSLFRIPGGRAAAEMAGDPATALPRMLARRVTKRSTPAKEAMNTRSVSGPSTTTW